MRRVALDTVFEQLQGLFFPVPKSLSITRLEISERQQEKVIILKLLQVRDAILGGEFVRQWLPIKSFHLLLFKRNGAGRPKLNCRG